MITDQRIRELRELCGKATPGPWRINITGHALTSEKETVCFDEELRNVDIAFISASRTAIPELLDELDAAEKALRRESDIRQEANVLIITSQTENAQLREENAVLREQNLAMNDEEVRLWKALQRLIATKKREASGREE